MPTFTSKAFNTFYKNLLGINQSGNTGVDSTVRTIQDGAGNDTSLSLSNEKLLIKPTGANSATTAVIQDIGGSNILAVDTANSRVLVGSSQIIANTMYAYFAATRMDFATAGNHYMVPFASSHPHGSGDALTEIDLLNGTDPATSLDISAEVVNANLFSSSLWYIPDPMTVDAIHITVAGTSSSTAQDINFHLMKYNFDVAGSTGDLTSGVVVADQGASGVISDVHQDAVKYVSLTVDTSNNSVSAGQVVILTVESTDTQEISCNATVKFHLN